MCIAKPEMLCGVCWTRTPQIRVLGLAMTARCACSVMGNPRHATSPLETQAQPRFHNCHGIGVCSELSEVCPRIKTLCSLESIASGICFVRLCRSQLCCGGFFMFPLDSTSILFRH